MGKDIAVYKSHARSVLAHPNALKMKPVTTDLLNAIVEGIIGPKIHVEIEDAQLIEDALKL